MIACGVRMRIWELPRRPALLSHAPFQRGVELPRRPALLSHAPFQRGVLQSTLKISKLVFESTFNLQVKKGSQIPAKFVATERTKKFRVCVDPLKNHIFILNVCTIVNV